MGGMHDKAMNAGKSDWLGNVPANDSSISDFSSTFPSMSRIDISLMTENEMAEFLLAMVSRDAGEAACTDKEVVLSYTSDVPSMPEWETEREWWSMLRESHEAIRLSTGLPLHESSKGLPMRLRERQAKLVRVLSGMAVWRRESGASMSSESDIAALLDLEVFMMQVVAPGLPMPVSKAARAFMDMLPGFVPGLHVRWQPTVMKDAYNTLADPLRRLLAPAH